MINKLGFGFLRLPKRGDDYDWNGINLLVDEFMSGGGNYFDTCYTYLDGKSEEAIKRCVVLRKPRNSFRLAEKLPGYMCKNQDDCERYFSEELERCGVDYFDVYMLHWLTAKHYKIAEETGQFDFIEKKKKEGKVGLTGFSYHDSPELLEEILSSHPEVDLVQLQINYLDWESEGIASKRCYDIALRHGKKVIVMEPIKGGSLSSLPADAEKILRDIHPDRTPSDWALRFVQSLPGVEVCLSGMNTPEQVTANIKPFEILSEKEKEALFRVCDIINKNTAVPCTGCGYCLSHCQKKIAIPSYFRMYNELCRYPDESWKIKPLYRQSLKEHGGAADCIECHSCEMHCPQHIKITENLKKVSEAFDGKK